MLAEPELGLRIIATMAHLLVVLNQRVEELLLPVPARLARYLLDLCSEQGSPTQCRLAFAKQELAARLGTVPETLSRTLNRFVRGGLIAVDGNAFEVLNRPPGAVGPAVGAGAAGGGCPARRGMGSCRYLEQLAQKLINCSSRPTSHLPCRLTRDAAFADPLHTGPSLTQVKGVGRPLRVPLACRDACPNPRPRPRRTRRQRGHLKRKRARPWRS